MKMRPIFLSFILILGILTAGCGSLNGAAPEERSLALEVLYKGSQCGTDGGAGASWIERPQDLPAAFRRTGSFNWRVESEGVLWIRMGSQPSGGYGLELANPLAIVRNRTATIRIDWRYPPSDSFVTLAFTSPCILLKIPKAGLASIQVVDQEGLLRAQVALP